MLEVLLNEYEMRFGEAFPLARLAGMTEIEVINIVYECLDKNIKYQDGMRVENKFPDAPKKKQ